MLSLQISRFLRSTNPRTIRFAFALLAAAIVVVGYLVSKAPPRVPAKMDYPGTARSDESDTWWGKLQEGALYCFVDPAPTNELVSEPIARGYRVIAKRRDYFCPVGTTVVRRDGSQYPVTAQVFLNGSLALYQEGNFEKSIEISKVALALNPAYAEAYNNICAAQNAMKQWREAIESCTRAIELKPDFPLARNNLTWAKKMAAPK